MWVQMVYAAVVGVLLLSNIWMLRELEALKRQLDAYQREVASLDDRVCQLMYSVEAAEVSAQARSVAPTPGGR